MILFLGKLLASELVQTVIVGVVGILAAKYFKTSGRAAKAKEVLIIADAVTDKLLAGSPGSPVAAILDDAVDELMKSAKVSKDVASRAITEAYAKINRTKDDIKDIRDTVKETLERFLKR